MVPLGKKPNVLTGYNVSVFAVYMGRITSVILKWLLTTKVSDVTDAFLKVSVEINCGNDVEHNTELSSMRPPPFYSFYYLH